MPEQSTDQIAPKQLLTQYQIAGRQRGRRKDKELGKDLQNHHTRVCQEQKPKTTVPLAINRAAVGRRHRQHFNL